VHVPLEAVTPDEEDHSVVRVRKASGRVSVRWVQLGISNNKDVEIVKGIRAGELVYLAAGQGGGGDEE
jgi:hypothetical protein